MKKILFILSVFSLFVSCKQKEKEKAFEISGVIYNSPARLIYLDEIPMTTMQRVVVDSSEIDAKGHYKLRAGAAEARVYNLRMAQTDYPIAAVINDVSSITLNANFSKENNQFVESYEVKGSPASQRMKDFMTVFNSKLQTIFNNAKLTDSLTRVKGPDSLLAELENKSDAAAREGRQLTDSVLEKSDNPALTMFVLGYYQTMANNPGYRLPPFDKQEVIALIEKTAQKFPSHTGVAAILSSLQGWVGKQAPDFSLPDPNGKEISLSSFRGKYLLVDFWASWCRPCRNENPNVVKVYNKYKDKNFTILGVSLDRPGEKDAWMKAVMDDHLTWTQVSDLKYWDSPIVNLYKFGDQGIPYNVLIDPQGKIIAEALRGDALDARLAELLK